MTSTAAWRFVLLGYRMALGQPWLAVLIPLVGLLAFFALRALWQSRQRLEKVVAEPLLHQLAPRASVRRPIVKTSLGLVGLLLFAVALTQPQCGTRVQRIKRRGVDVVVALDASKSMLARDVKPSRLERAKLELSTLLDTLKGDRVGIVVFAGDAFTQCPLTSDYAAAKLFLKAVDPDQMQQGGTNVGGALLLARDVLSGVDRGAKQQVVVLLSDGEDLSGETDAAIEALKQANIEVLVVGIGSEAGEPIPLTNAAGQVVDYQKDSDGKTVVTRLDRAVLENLAQQTGGEFFYRPQGVAIPEVAERIDKMQKSELESQLAVEYDERYELFGWAGLILWTAGALLRPSRRGAPEARS